MCQENLKSVYYSYFHSLTTYGIICWGNSTHSIHVFWLQKRVISIITHSSPRDSCRQLFKQLGTLPLTSQYIFPFYCMLYITEFYSRWILKYIILILGMFLIFVVHMFIWQHTKMGPIILVKCFQLPSYSYKKFIS